MKTGIYKVLKKSALTKDFNNLLAVAEGRGLLVEPVGEFQGQRPIPWHKRIDHLIVRID